MWFYTVLLLLPFFIFLILLLNKKLRLAYISLFATSLLTIISAFVWQVGGNYITASIVKGVFVALDIYFIILGAILFLELVKRNKIIENISYYLESISKDLRIQVILLGWFLVNFIEGTAGFGTASTIVVPLLITLGISPLNSVVIGMLGNSASGLFGAAGTPIKIGFGSLANYELAKYALEINLTGIFVPVFILWFLVKSHKKSFKEFLEAVPFALWCGVAFSVPALFCLKFGLEFPSILGSLFGLFAVLITSKLGLFIPKTEPDLIDRSAKPTMGVFKSIFPYVVFILFLILGKVFIGTQGYKLNFLIPHTLAFYNPGFIFLLSCIPILFIYKHTYKTFLMDLKSALRKSFEPFLVIALMSAFAQLVLNSGHNYSGLPSMVNVLAVNFRNSFLPVWAPLMGAFGSFLTGSVTVSNIMFGGFIAESAKMLGMSVDKLLALTAVGGAAGNMIALGDIITSESVVGLINSERKVLKAVILPCLIYLFLICIIGLVIV